MLLIEALRILPDWLATSCDHGGSLCDSPLIDAQTLPVIGASYAASIQASFGPDSGLILFLIRPEILVGAREPYDCQKTL